jgi:hypothetical protein
MLRVNLYSNIDYINTLSIAYINPLANLTINDRTGSYSFYNLPGYGTTTTLSWTINFAAISAGYYSLSIDSTNTILYFQEPLTVSGVTGFTNINGTYTFTTNPFPSPGEYYVSSSLGLRLNPLVPPSGVWGNDGIVEIPANPIKQVSSWTDILLYTYNALGNFWYYPSAGQDYLDILSTFGLNTATKYDLTLSAATGNKQSGNWPQGIYVFNVVFLGAIDSQSIPTIAVVADVICRKLQELSDDILYQRACCAKTQQYDELSRVWNLCYNQLVRTMIDYRDYFTYNVLNIDILNQNLIESEELAKAVSLYKEALVIAQQNIDCNGCK